MTITVQGICVTGSSCSCSLYDILVSFKNTSCKLPTVNSLADLTVRLGVGNA